MHDAPQNKLGLGGKVRLIGNSRAITGQQNTPTLPCAVVHVFVWLQMGVVRPCHAMRADKEILLMLAGAARRPQGKCNIYILRSGNSYVKKINNLFRNA